MTVEALCPRRLLTPNGFEQDRCLLIEDGTIRAVRTRSECPTHAGFRELDGDLVPGFIDLQVNGGGGVLFNDRPDVDGVKAIARAHRRFGTTGLLPTLISDDLKVVARAIGAVDQAIEQGVPGILGIHIEGPFLSEAKKGIHDASKFRTIDAEAIEILSSLKRGKTLVTLAPERAPSGTVRALVDRGVIVAAGHTNASYDQVRSALDEGMSGFTHLYNAMTQLGSREPGAVGAALDDRNSWCGLIVDGHHVHPAALRIALATKGPDWLVLVTDAMPTVGSTKKQFTLGDRTITTENGRLTDAAGTLAGSDLDMAQAVRNAQRLMGVDLATAIHMASRSPARALGLADRLGAIEAGYKADLVLLNSDGEVLETWIDGRAEAA